MRAVTVMLLLGIAGVARGEVVFTLGSPQSIAGQIVNLRVDETDFHCFSATTPEVILDGATVRVRYEIEDFTPPGTPPGTCPAYRVTPRLDSLGAFAPGSYTVEVTTCSNPVPPTPPCAVRATLDLIVFGTKGARFTVPTLSAWAAISMAAVMLLAGAVWRGRAP